MCPRPIAGCRLAEKMPHQKRLASCRVRGPQYINLPFGWFLLAGRRGRTHKNRRRECAVTVVTYKVGGSVHTPKLRGATYAIVHASAVRSCRGDRDSCVLCSVPSRSLSVARPNNAQIGLTQAHALQRWRLALPRVGQGSFSLRLLNIDPLDARTFIRKKKRREVLAPRREVMECHASKRSASIVRPRSNAVNQFSARRCVILPERCA
jgi:hypothetical protein